MDTWILVILGLLFTAGVVYITRRANNTGHGKPIPSPAFYLLTPAERAEVEAKLKALRDALPKNR
jgi:hypothetical protein